MPPLPVQPQWGLAFPCIEDTDILLAEEEFVNRKVFFAYFLMPTTVVKASLSFFSQNFSLLLPQIGREVGEESFQPELQRQKRNGTCMYVWQQSGFPASHE